jgi:hypothetical protein
MTSQTREDQTPAHAGQMSGGCDISLCGCDLTSPRGAGVLGLATPEFLSIPTVSCADGGGEGVA